MSDPLEILGLDGSPEPRSQDHQFPGVTGSPTVESRLPTLQTIRFMPGVPMPKFSTSPSSSVLQRPTIINPIERNKDPLSSALQKLEAIAVPFSTSVSVPKFAIATTSVPTPSMFGAMTEISYSNSLRSPITSTGEAIAAVGQARPVLPYFTTSFPSPPVNQPSVSSPAKPCAVSEAFLGIESAVAHGTAILQSQAQPAPRRDKDVTIASAFHQAETLSSNINISTTFSPIPIQSAGVPQVVSIPSNLVSTTVPDAPSNRIVMQGGPVNLQIAQSQADLFVSTSLPSDPIFPAPITSNVSLINDSRTMAQPLVLPSSGILVTKDGQVVTTVAKCSNERDRDQSIGSNQNQNQNQTVSKAVKRPRTNKRSTVNLQSSDELPPRKKRMVTVTQTLQQHAKTYPPSVALGPYSRSNLNTKPKPTPTPVKISREDIAYLVMPSEDWSVNLYPIPNQQGKSIYVISETVLNSDYVEYVRKSISLLPNWKMKFSVMAQDASHFNLGSAASVISDIQCALDTFHSLPICGGFTKAKGGNKGSIHPDKVHRSEKCYMMLDGRSTTCVPCSELR